MKTRGTVSSIGGEEPPVNETLLSAKMAAARLGMSESWLHGSNVPHVKLGRRKLYRPSDLSRYVNSRVSHRIDPETQ
jgi:hypothetical protein